MPFLGPLDSNEVVTTPPVEYSQFTENGQDYLEQSMTQPPDDQGRFCKLQFLYTLPDTLSRIKTFVGRSTGVRSVSREQLHERLEDGERIALLQLLSAGHTESREYMMTLPGFSSSDRTAAPAPDVQSRP